MTKEAAGRYNEGYINVPSRLRYTVEYESWELVNEELWGILALKTAREIYVKVEHVGKAMG